MSRHTGLFRRRRREKIKRIVFLLLGALLLAGLVWYLFFSPWKPLGDIVQIQIALPGASPAQTDTPATAYATPTDAASSEPDEQSTEQPTEQPTEEPTPVPTPTPSPTPAPTPTRTPHPTLVPTPVATATPVPASVIERSARTQYRVSLDVNIEDMTVDGKLYLHYVNTSRDTLYAIQLYLHANGAAPGSLSINSVGIDNVRTYYSVSGESQNLLMIPLKYEITPYQSADVFIDFTAAIPVQNARFGKNETGIMLGNLIPTMCKYENSAWRSDAYCAAADPFFSDIADYTVSVKLRQDYLLACTGDVENISNDNGCNRYYIKANSVRDFALALMNADTTRIRTRNVDGVTITGYGTTTTIAQLGVEAAAGALEYFNENIGKYPYKTLHVVPFQASGGMEYPGLVMIDSSYLRTSYQSYGKLIVSHEVAHQWFYAVLGSDQVNSPWLDESLVEFLAQKYVEHARINNLNAILNWRKLPGSLTTPRVLTDSIYAFTSGDATDYYYVVYCYGASMYGELCELIGEDAFFTALKSLYNEYYMGTITRDALVGEFSDAAGQDLTEWFNERLSHRFSGDTPTAAPVDNG